ncbi:MAG TPA: hypothetical protein VKS78_04265 [Roseiarcus sp.]|nr:hypothetical protein [Roseiarcus sp.]
MNTACKLEQPSLQAILDNNRFDAIERLANRAASYATIAAESAYLGRGRDVHSSLGQLGLVVVEAIKIAEALGKDNADADLER